MTLNKALGATEQLRRLYLSVRQNDKQKSAPISGPVLVAARPKSRHENWLSVASGW